jgi:putative transcriptional regulator
LKNQELRQLRGKRTIQEVADRIGIPRSTYNCIENGIRKGRPETMHKIAKFYGVSIEQVFFQENLV